MNEQVMRFRVGVMMLAVLIIAATLVLLIGRMPALVEGTYTVTIDFKSAPGVGVNTPVKKFGMLIGRVSSVEINEDNTGALVTVKISSKFKDNLRVDEVAMVNTSMLGDAVIEFVDSDVNATPNEFIQDGGRIEGDVRSNPLDVIAHIEGDLGTAIKSIAKTSDEIRALAHNVNDILGANDDQFTRIVDKTEQTIDALRVAVGNIDELLSDQQLKDDLKRAIANFPVVLEEARETVSGLKNTLAGVDRNLANLEGLTKPLGERGGKLVENIESSTAKLDAVLSDISEFSQGLNDPKGTLGQLLNNPDLYQQANSAVANLNELTKELRPIVSDVRTFTSKISRHPNQLIFRSSGAKYSDLEMSGAGPAAPSTRSGFAPRGAR